MPITISGKQTIDEVIENIAQKKLGIPTLETRGSDSLDFYDVAVWQVRDALQAAYEGGFSAGQKSGC